MKDVMVGQNMNSQTVESNPASPGELSLIKIMGLEVTPLTLKEKFLLATFQIIAEHGANALSANELIKKTDSSKGALFHHFKTLDDLCLESLNYFRTHARLSLHRSQFSSLKDFLQALVEDAYERQSNKAFFHIMHFFRDRALKDERFKKALDEVYAGYLNFYIEMALIHLPAHVDRDQVREMIIFVYFTLERICYRRMTATEKEKVEEIVLWFVESVEKRFNQLKAR
ncbi:MAG: TetR family transcriptional regulator [Bdellovibrionales bacterium]